MRGARLPADDPRDRRSANAGSIGVHTRTGFQMIGTHPSVGLKFGHWLDTVMMQRALGEGAATVPGRVAENKIAKTTPCKERNPLQSKGKFSVEKATATTRLPQRAGLAGRSESRQNPGGLRFHSGKPGPSGFPLSRFVAAPCISTGRGLATARLREPSCDLLQSAGLAFIASGAVAFGATAYRYSVVGDLIEQVIGVRGHHIGEEAAIFGRQGTNAVVRCGAYKQFG